MPNAVSPYDIIAQAADIYIAPVATVMPTILQSLTPNNLFSGTGIAGQVTTGGALNSWYYLGYTEAGVTVMSSQTIKEITVDQTTYPVKATRSLQSLSIAFSIAELTLANFQHAYGEAASVAGAQEHHIDMNLGPSVQTIALCVRVPSPAAGGDGSWLAQFEFPTVYQGGNPSAKFIKADKAMLALDFKALGIAGSFGTFRTRDA